MSSKAVRHDTPQGNRRADPASFHHVTIYGRSAEKLVHERRARELSRFDNVINVAFVGTEDGEIQAELPVEDPYTLWPNVQIFLGPDEPTESDPPYSTATRAASSKTLSEEEPLELINYVDWVGEPMDEDEGEAATIYLRSQPLPPLITDDAEKRNEHLLFWYELSLWILIGYTALIGMGIVFIQLTAYEVSGGTIHRPPLPASEILFKPSTPTQETKTTEPSVPERALVSGVGNTPMCTASCTWGSLNTEGLPVAVGGRKTIVCGETTYSALVVPSTTQKYCWDATSLLLAP